MHLSRKAARIAHQASNATHSAFCCHREWTTVPVNTAHLLAFSALLAGCLARNRAECLKLGVRGLVSVLMMAFAGLVAAIGSQVMLIAQFESLDTSQLAELVCEDRIDALAFLVAADELE